MPRKRLRVYELSCRQCLVPLEEIVDRRSDPAIALRRTLRSERDGPGLVHRERIEDVRAQEVVEGSCRHGLDHHRKQHDTVVGSEIGVRSCNFGISILIPRWVGRI